MPARRLPQGYGREQDTQLSPNNSQRTSLRIPYASHEYPFATDVTAILPNILTPNIGGNKPPAPPQGFGPHNQVTKPSRPKYRGVKPVSRFMPPPPPSLQAARVISVCLNDEGNAFYTGGAEGKARAISTLVTAQARVHGPDGKTCISEGEFAFLTKVPFSSDWGWGGYGASYSATVEEGAPTSTFQRLDPASDGFQLYLTVLMKWYSKVARQFGSNDPNLENAFADPLPPTDGPRAYLRPIVAMPGHYFSPTFVPPCPQPERYFSIQQAQKEKLAISDIEQFIVWHGAIQAWWDGQIKPRSLGYMLFTQLLQNTDTGNPYPSISARNAGPQHASPPPFLDSAPGYRNYGPAPPPSYPIGK